MALQPLLGPGLPQRTPPFSYISGLILGVFDTSQHTFLRVEVVPTPKPQAVGAAPLQTPRP